jgi:hypothetical protein
MEDREKKSLSVDVSKERQKVKQVLNLSKNFPFD